MIRSVLVANRGEIARRVFRTCRDLGIRTVAVHSDADASAPFVAEADVAVHLVGNSPTETYLRADLVIDAARRAGADAIHPGYGFLSENADFARAVAEAGLVWIGPTPESIDAMGSKIRAKEIMAEAGVPILSIEPETAQPGDFPLLVKASAGGGGRGMRVVERSEDLEGELTAAAAEAVSAFGDDTVFVEPYLPTARHVEVQVLADTHGTTWILGDRDCSIQRRHQKVVEEAPAPNLSDAVRRTLHTAARNAAEAVGYVGAGTVEFLVSDGHADDGRVFFLEMNTRLQVEHPVTEEVFGIDLVALQVSVAEGHALPTDEPTGPTGHAIEVRLYAEDAGDDWAPQTGTLRTFEVPSGPGLRTDSAVESGSVVTHFYDAMIAKVVAYADDRTQAVRRLDDALRRTRVHGLTTNVGLLRGVLADEEFVAGRVHTALLAERIADWTKPLLDDAAVQRAALAAALAQARTASTSSPVLGRIPTAFRNVPSQPRTRRLRVGDEEIVVEYRAEGGRLVSDLADVVEASPSHAVLLVDGVTETYRVTVADETVDVDGPAGSLSFDVVPTFVDPADVVAEGSLLAPMPASVVQVGVEAGQQVTKGDVVVVLEAMKMQHTITAPVDGVVTELAVTAGQQVESGAVLAVIETIEGKLP
ncbi:biotin carboxylase N-terminal domain-containing protein [Aeromicrobium sp. Leaf291]|uniref:acetyl/propionyl/methylcrotonyl-CoA carboxylase subunit alpha n=1 Tax=Aeromicrobium sp. Leaf291 TaxID=1736325 RepID=UPI0006FD962A|nr:biotin carboxylase N-terminal domain-containing protein [Aeromicrobium sp. Leaf291]KQP83949.1 acetyl/propionyl-CoA carboxylase subuit alpha [Aeromicrobium sp. Leaf291]